MKIFNSFAISLITFQLVSTATLLAAAVENRRMVFTRTEIINASSAWTMLVTQESNDGTKWNDVLNGYCITKISEIPGDTLIEIGTVIPESSGPYYGEYFSFNLSDRISPSKIKAILQKALEWAQRAKENKVESFQKTIDQIQNGPTVETAIFIVHASTPGVQFVNSDGSQLYAGGGRMRRKLDIDEVDRFIYTIDALPKIIEQLKQKIDKARSEHESEEKRKNDIFR